MPNWCEGLLHPKHTGPGYASEAVRALLEVAFYDLRLGRMMATCFAENDASVVATDGTRR